MEIFLKNKTQYAEIRFISICPYVPVTILATKMIINIRPAHFFIFLFMGYDDKFLLLMLDMQYFIGWKQATVYQQLQCCFWISKVRPKKSSMYPLFLCICSFKISSYIQFHTARRETTKNSFQKKKAKEKLYLLIVFPVTFTWIRMDI